MPDSSPWVNYKLYATNDIDSTPTLVFGSQYAARLWSILAVNRTEFPFFLEMNILRDGNLSYPFIVQQKIEPYETKEIIPYSGFIMEGGDTLFGNTDFSGNRFTSLISYEELLELPAQ